MVEVESLRGRFRVGAESLAALLSGLAAKAGTVGEGARPPAAIPSASVAWSWCSTVGSGGAPAFIDDSTRLSVFSTVLNFSASELLSTGLLQATGLSDL